MKGGFKYFTAYLGVAIGELIPSQVDFYLTNFGSDVF